MRWRRFQGLLFAPEKRAQRACPAPFAGLPHLSRPRPGCDWAAVRPLLFDRSPPGPFAARLSPHGCAGSGTANEARRPKGRTPRGGLRGAFERFGALLFAPSPHPSCTFFCSWFDSDQARQTVRWRRFWGLEFAPVFAAGTDAVSRARLARARAAGRLARPARPCRARCRSGPPLARRGSARAAP